MLTNSNINRSAQDEWVCPTPMHRLIVQGLEDLMEFIRQAYLVWCLHTKANRPLRENWLPQEHCTHCIIVMNIHTMTVIFRIDSSCMLLNWIHCLRIYSMYLYIRYALVWVAWGARVNGEGICGRPHTRCPAGNKGKVYQACRQLFFMHV